MEGETASEQTKSSTTVMLLWILAGLLIVSSVYLVVPCPTDLWPALNAAGLAAGLYLIALVVFIGRKPLRFVARIVLGCLALTVIGLTGFVWLKSQSNAVRQAENRWEQSAMSARGTATFAMSGIFLRTLEEYYQREARKKETLGEVFRRLNNGAGVGANLTKTSVPVVVEMLEPNRVVLVAQAKYLKGRNPDFLNKDGKKGKLQEKMILTERGVAHESEN